MRFLALAASALLLVAAGCGSKEGASPATGASTTEENPPPATATVPETSPAVVALYFLREGKVGLARRGVVAGAKIGTAALEALLEGPTAKDRQAGLVTAIPSGTRLKRLAIAEGTAAASFSRELPPEAAAQVVYTLTQFPTVRRVEVGPGPPVRRADLEELTPPILVESPAPWEQASSPLRITGTANTFEATFNVEVRDEKGGVLGERFVTATSGSGTRGTFDASVKFSVERPGPGRLVVFELSAEDGSRIHEVEIPLQLR